VPQTTQHGVDRGLPWSLGTALLLAIVVALVLASAAPRYVDSPTLVYLEKLRRAADGPAVDVMVLGASQSVAAIRPRDLEFALPLGTRMYNYAAPALAPSGGEVLLRRYLAGHEAPRLLVLGFAPMMYGDRRGEFERFTLKDALGPREVFLAALADRRPGYGLSWLSTRPATVRYREGLRSALGVALLDRVPPLRAALQGWLGSPDHPAARYRFDWRYRERSRRNTALLSELELDGGWHYWKESAHGGKHTRGAPGWSGRGESDLVEPFRLSPREAAAVERLLASCREHGIRVLVPSMPHAAWFSAALRADGGGERLDAFWSDLAARPGVRVVGPPTVDYPSRLFSDSMHLDPKGAERFGRVLAPQLARAFRVSD